jgi:hypothetical protein
MSTLAAKTPATSDVPTRRPAVPERWGRLRRFDALEDLLNEFAVWAAPWTGFPLVRNGHGASAGRGHG